MTELIEITLEEAPATIDPQLSESDHEHIKSVVALSIIAKKVKTKPINPIIKSAIAELLASPGGLSKKDLLLASDTDNILSLIPKIKNYLKSDDIYTLKKKGKGQSLKYYIINTKADSPTATEIINAEIELIRTGPYDN